MRKLTANELLTARHFRVARDITIADRTTKYLVFNQPERGFVKIDQYAVIAPENIFDGMAGIPVANRIPITTFRIFNGNEIVLPHGLYLTPYPGVLTQVIPNAAFNDEYLCLLNQPLEFNDHIFIQFPWFRMAIADIPLMPIPCRVIMSGMIYILGIEEPFEEKSDLSRVTSGEGEPVEDKHPPDVIIEGIR